jgi:glutaconate CoA-transferase, subunit B
VIGDYEKPKVRLPGGGGAPEIAAMAKQVIVIIRQSPRTFVEKLDFRSSIGYGEGPGDRERLKLPGAGPTVVITDLGVLRPDPESRELTMTQLQPGVSLQAAQEATGWELQAADDLGEAEPPTPEELDVLRKLKATIEAVEA